jgi:hypothetical protein
VALETPAPMMRCPLCEYEGARGELHAHLVSEHADAVETWTDAASGKMHYRVQCPLCEADHEARVKPRSQDPDFLQTFAREIRLVAFDMLLNHLEAEHAALPGGRTAEPAPLRSSLPPSGPGGGRGRPGANGVPLPPGMDEPDLPPWAQGDAALPITHVEKAGDDK